MQNETGIAAAVLIRDLIFETKIRSTGVAVGTPVHVIRGPGELPVLLATGGVWLVIVDLNSAGPGACDAIRIAKHHAGVQVVAFVSHVDVQLAELAQEAGADEVMPRSVFTAKLPDLLSRRPGINPGSTIPR